MTDDADPKRNDNHHRVKKKDKDAAKEHTPDTSTPSPSEPEFTAWLDRLWRDNERVDFLVVKQLILGRGGRVVAEGEVVKRYAFPQGKAPTADDVVRVTNELVAEMQNEADNLRQPRAFAVDALNAQKDAGQFARWTITREPKRLILRKDRDGDIAPMDDDDGAYPGLGGDRLLRRVDAQYQDHRWHTDTAFVTLGQQIQLLIEQLKDSYKNNKDALEGWMTALKEKNIAENNALDRELARDTHRLKLDAARTGMNLVAGLLPGVIKKVTNGAAEVAGGQSYESMQIEAVMKGLTDQEKRRVFGEWTNEGQRVSPGILSEEQVRIIVGVLRDERPAKDLARLLDGPDAITQQQNVEIATSVDVMKLLPLRDALSGLQKELAKPAAPTTTALPPPAPKG